MVAIVAGISVIGSAALFERGRRPAMGRVGIGIALLVALAISLYSAVDGVAVKSFQPRGLLALVFSLSTPVVFPWGLRRYGAGYLARLWRQEWRPVTAAAVLIVRAYLPVLIAYAIAPVGYGGCGG